MTSHQKVVSLRCLFSATVLPCETVKPWKSGI